MKLLFLLITVWGPITFGQEVKCVAKCLRTMKHGDNTIVVHNWDVDVTVDTFGAAKDALTTKCKTEHNGDMILHSFIAADIDEDYGEKAQEIVAYPPNIKNHPQTQTPFDQTKDCQRTNKQDKLKSPLLPVHYFNDDDGAHD